MCACQLLTRVRLRRVCEMFGGALISTNLFSEASGFKSGQSANHLTPDALVSVACRNQKLLLGINRSEVGASEGKLMPVVAMPRESIH